MAISFFLKSRSVARDLYENDKLLGVTLRRGIRVLEKRDNLNFVAAIWIPRCASGFQMKANSITKY